MEDPEPFSTIQETNENNNVDFKNVLNGSVLSSLSKSLDLALLENSMSVHLDDKLASSASCDPATISAPPTTIGCSDDTRAVSSTPLAVVTEEQSRGQQNLLLPEENIPESSVSCSSCGDQSQTSLIPRVNSLHGVSASKTKKITNETMSLNETAHEYRDMYSRSVSPTTVDSNSEELPDIADTERISASTSFSTCSPKKLCQDNAYREQTLAATNSSTCSFQKLLPDTTDTEPTSASISSTSEKVLPGTADTVRTLAATSSLECSSQKSSERLTDNEPTLVAANFSNGLSAESPPLVPRPFMSLAASSSHLDLTSSVFPRSSSSLSGPDAFSFPAKSPVSESSGDSTDYEDAFDWDLSGNIEYYDFKDREKVKLKQSVPRQQDPGTSGIDFTNETWFMKATSPLKCKRTHDDDEHHLANPSTIGLRSGKKFKSSEVGNHLHVPGSSTSFGQPNLITHTSTVNGASNSFDDWILSSSTSSNKPSSVSVSKAPSTLSTRASKPLLRCGTVTSCLRTPSFKSHIGINPKLTSTSRCSPASLPSTSRGSTASSLPTGRGYTAMLRPTGRGNTALPLPTGRGNTALSLSTGRGNTALLLPTGRGSTALPSSTDSGFTGNLRTASSSSKGNGSTAACPDPVSAQPNRARLREVILDVMGRHKRARVLEAERTKKFAACRKKLLGDILKRLHTLQAYCVEGLM